MRVPRLNRQLSLEAPVRISDGAGGFEQNWMTLGVVWAELTARAGRETAQAGQPVALNPWRVVVRAAPVGHPERPQPGQRFVGEGRVLLIRAVAEMDAGARYLMCVAEEEVSP